MFDPQEGMDPDGTIRTGANRSRVPPVFEPLLAACVAEASTSDPSVSTYLYGSVATGMARPRVSDVDVLTVGLSRSRAGLLRKQLSDQFADVCRGVEIAVASPQDYLGGDDQAYGNRVFLRHYCIHLAGPEIRADVRTFPADRRAARGFNGDIGRHRDDWLCLLKAETATVGPGPADLGRRVARKTLLAVAGLVSVDDSTWTTERHLAARRWAASRPAQAEGLRLLESWSEAASTATRDELDTALHTGGIVDLVVQDFGDMVGLWAD